MTTIAQSQERSNLNANNSVNQTPTAEKIGASKAAEGAKLKFVNEYINGDDGALEKLLTLNQQAKKNQIPMSSNEKLFWQEYSKSSKKKAADARERVGTNPEKLAEINNIEKRIQTIVNIAANQLTEKP
ncbi:MAG: hypothetical protein ACKO3R_08145 [bacterium]